MTSALRRLCCLALFAVTLAAPLSACSTATKTTAAAGLDDSISSLAGAGVAVVDEVTSQAPIVAVTGTPSAMRFTRWEVQNLVAEANAHSGYLASELDGLATPPPGSPNLSALIAAWLTRHDDPLAQYAATFMNGQVDKKSGIAVFPTLVVLSFIADIARAPATTSQAPAPHFDFERLIASPAEAQIPGCSDVSNFVSTVVTNVTNAIQANGSSWLATFWNIVVATVSTAISTVTSILTPLVAFITKIATICATIMQVTSMFKPWTVALAGSPASITLNATPQSGSFDATLNAKDVPWPSQLVGCVAALSNIKLDDASYADAPVTWTEPINIPGLATNVSADTTLLANKTAHYTFSTITVDNVESTDCPTLVPAGKLGITVTVERADISKTLTSLESLITGSIPAALRTYLAPYIDQATDAVNTVAGKFAAPHQSSIIMLKEEVADPLCIHTPPPSTPAPSDTPTHAAVSVTLPFLPCEAMLQPDDSEPYLNGAYFVTGAGAVRFAKIMGALTGLGGEMANDYDNTRSSYCLLGTGTMPDPDPNNPNAPVTAEIAAIMVTIPRGSLGYVAPKPLDASDAASNPCVAAIGTDTLNRLKARCIDGSVTVMIQAPEVEIAVTGITKAGPNIMVPPPGAIYKVLAHLLKRYAP
jgi:hypothetical protein